MKEDQKICARKAELEPVSSDVTRHKKTQKALRESEEGYRALFGNIPGMVYRGKPDWSVDVISNPEKICGYNVEEFTSQKVNWAKIIHPDDREMVLEDASKLEKERASTIQEYRIKAKDGTIHWVEDHKVSIITDAGVFIGVDGVVFDITERKKAEEALRKSEERYRMLCESSLDGIATANLNGTITDCNRAYAQMLGYSSEELKKIRYQDITPSRWHELNEKMFLQVMKRGYSDVFEKEYIRKDGTVFPVSLHAWRMDDEGGNAVGVGAIVRDISERKKAEEQLKQSREFLNNTINALDDSFFVKDEEHRWIIFNDAACKAIGHPREELIGKSDYDFFPKEQADVFWEKDNLVFETGETSINEEEITWQGKLHTISTKKSLFKDSITGKRYIVGTVRDITERKQMEKTLRESEQKYRALVEQSLQGIVILQDYRIIFANKAAMEIAGLTIDEARSLTLEDMMAFIPPENRAATLERLKNRFAGKNEPGNYELRLMRRNGEEFWLNLFFSNIEYHGKFAIQLAFVDITDQKRMEEALRRSEKRFREIFENTAVGIYRTTPDGRILMANPALINMLGYSSYEELSQRNLEEKGFEPQYQRSVFKEEIERKGRIISWESVWKTRDGNALHVIENARVVKDENGNIQYYEGTAENITERKKAEEALIESEEKFRNLAEQSPNMIFINRRSRVVYANAKCEEVMGYKREEFYHPDFDFMTLIAPEFRQLIKTNFGRHMNGEEIEPYEYGLITEDGERLDAIITTKLMKYGGENSILGIITDITERKKAHEEITKLAKFPAEDPNPVLRIAKDSTILYANNASSVVLDTWERNIGEQLPEACCKRIEEVFNSGKASSFEFHCHNGQIFEVKLAPVVESGYANAYGLDITERKKAEEKLLDYQDQLKSLASQLTLAEERERRRIATELHDEISQSLFISKMKLEALHTSVSDKKSVNALDEISNSLGRIIAAMRSLTFDLSSPILYEFGFEDAVAEWLNERVGRKYGIETEFEDDGLPKPLDDDIRVLLFRNVRELLINVVKHASAKKIKVSIKKVGDRIHICVEDDGLGFDSANAELMINNKKAFGLFSIRERLEHLGGNLDIKSSPGCGCRVTITSPLKREDIREDKRV